MNYHPLTYPGNIYHLYSQALGNEQLFRCDSDYYSLLQKYFKYIVPIADTYSWVLTPTQIDFIVSIKSSEKILTHFEKMKNAVCPDTNLLPDFIMERFSNWLNSYVKTFNNKYIRQGRLFADYLKRDLIETKSHLKSSIINIHNTPVKKGLCNSVSDWSWSSYKTLSQNQHTTLLRNDIMQLFGSQNTFVKSHQLSATKENGILVH